MYVTPLKAPSLALLREIKARRGRLTLGKRGRAYAALWQRGLISRVDGRITEAGLRELENAKRPLALRRRFPEVEEGGEAREAGRGGQAS